MKKINVIIALSFFITCSALADSDLKLIERAIQNLRSMQSIKSLPEVDQKYYVEALENLDTAQTAISSGKKYFEYPLGLLSCEDARSFIVHLASSLRSVVHTFDCTDSLLKGVFDRARRNDPVDFSYPGREQGFVDDRVANLLVTLAIDFGSIVTEGQGNVKAEIKRLPGGDKYIYRIDVY